MKKILAGLSILVLLISVLLSSSAIAKRGGPPIGKSGGGGSSTSSPDYGDLVILLRDANGVPIPSANGCPLQPLNILGVPIPLDLECEIEPECTITGGCAPVEVYFGRTSMARSPESVLTAGFDEVISTIKASLGVYIGPAGRLVLEMEVLDFETGSLETVYKTIDSPRENLALYVQIMKFGHLQTADGVVADTHGDEIIIRPALDPLVDYAKFPPELYFLLPANDGATGVEKMTNADFSFISSCLAAAADKTGEVTIDMVQYLNNILGIPNATNSLPENRAFVDFRNVNYQRVSHFDKNVVVLQPGATPNTWQEEEINLLDWLGHINGNQSAAKYNIDGFVKSTNDALRVIEFIHNYEVPENLW